MRRHGWNDPSSNGGHGTLRGQGNAFETLSGRLGDDVIDVTFAFNFDALFNI
jgi:hypothetical protein